MARKYTSLRHNLPPSALTLRRPDQEPLRPVSPDSPAIDVMTDLYKTMPVTVEHNVSIEGANQKMIDHGVRLLFVMDGRNVILGIITATDILGEKPMAYLQKVGGTRSDITVKDIMTPRDALEALDIEDVLKACVGDIVATLKEAGRQHTLVVELDRETNTRFVRGLFSATQIGRQLGTRIEVGDVAKTFAGLERVLTSPL